MSDNRWQRGDARQKAQLIIQRFGELKNRRAPFMKQWIAISKYISPFSGRFSVNDHGENRTTSFILDSEATYDHKILTSGLMSGASSPARAWFKLQPKSEELMDNYDVIDWCAKAENIMQKIFQQSNTYNTLHQIYKELVLFGTAVDLIYDDLNNIIQHHMLTAGEYCLDTNDKGDVDTLYREFQLTTIQAVKAFGFKVCPREIQDAYNRGELGTYWNFLHAIEPRIDRDINAHDVKNKAWGSYYLSLGTSEQGILKESGFDYFPVIAPRWDILGIEPYGTSPSQEMLPDIKQLQQETLRKAELIENYTKPPLQVPNSARQNPIMLSSGAINFTATTGNDQMIKPIIGSTGDLNALIQDIASIKESIRRGFYVDLFMIVQQTAGDRRTTVEINALQQEQMLSLGAVMERMQNELLGKLVMITFQKMLERKAIPELPADFQNGIPLDIAFTSVLAQSQKAVDINTVDRFTSAIFASAQAMPEIIDRIDPDGYVDEYVARLGVAPKLIRSREEAERIRQQRAQAQQAQQEQAESMMASQQQEQMAQAQKTGAEASLAMQQLDMLGSGAMI